MAGGARLGGDDDEGFNDINIVPLVDIMLVLLIIFMVTTEFVDKPPEIPDALPTVPIELPSAASADRAQSTTLLSIALDSTGDIFLNGEKSSLDGIKARVAALKAKGDKTEAFVAADKRLAHGQVVAVIDALRLLGVADVALNTKPMEIE
jgi:biopolymer transport protein ExbD